MVDDGWLADWLGVVITRELTQAQSSSASLIEGASVHVWAFELQDGAAGGNSSSNTTECTNE